MRGMDEKLRLCGGTGRYDEGLSKIRCAGETKTFFGELHPELLPYVGQNYGKTRVLLVGESHYVEGTASRPANWYHEPLPEVGVSPYDRAGAKDWFDTREVLVRYVNQKNMKNIKNYQIGEAGKGHLVFRNPMAEFEALETGLGAGCVYRDIDHFAFMNYFQRPSDEKGGSISANDEDCRAAYEVFTQVIEVLRPKGIIFLSKLAYREYCGLGGADGSEVQIVSVSHPTCAWWHKRRKDGGCGKSDFRAYLSEILCEKQANN